MRILIATCSPAEAEPLLRSLLEDRLVACGNLVPAIRSMYWWEGELQSDEEVLMLMETAASLVDEATAALRERHSYDVPKILVLDPEDVDPDYLAWVRGVTRGGAS